MRLTRIALALACGLSLVAPAAAKTLRFSGYDFVARGTGTGGPGPNRWEPRNAWLDAQGRLHLKLSRQAGRWYAAEVHTRKRLGFGRYTFTVSGPIDRLDRNVVFSPFNYPPASVGPDSTNEIDIEFSRWGDAKGPNGLFTVWPAVFGRQAHDKAFSFSLPGPQSAHSFVWRPDSVSFSSKAVLPGGGTKALASWRFAPQDPKALIGQRPVQLYFNIWLFQGTPPSDGRGVEIVVDDFTFTPLP